MRDLRSVASAHSAMRVMPLRKPWPMPAPSRAIFLGESRYQRIVRWLNTRWFLWLMGGIDLALAAFLVSLVLGRR